MSDQRQRRRRSVASFSPAATASSAATSPLRCQRRCPAPKGSLLRRPGTTGCPEGWGLAEAEIFDRDAVAAIVARFKPDLVVHLAGQTRSAKPRPRRKKRGG